MTPTYLSFSPASSPAEELHQAQQDHGEFYCRQQPQEQADKYVPRDEYSTAHSTEQSDGNCKQEHDVMMKGEDHCSTGSVLSVKWMSSKMRLMKKMMNADQTVMNKPTQTTSDTDNSINSSSCHNNNNNNIVRTCSDCNTTKTPLWRSGPRGPKSLCNACGIRQRKARRAMAAAQADTLVVSSETSSTSGAKLHMKAKRCKLTARRNRKKLCFEDLAVSLSKNAAYHQVFPQDEKEAAILLMALSCGLALC